MSEERNENSRETIVKLYDRLTGLVDKLPGGLQKPILKELGPIREVFLESRPARILVLGSGGVPLAGFFRELAAGVEPAVAGSDNGWRRYGFGARGEIDIFDARDAEADAAFGVALDRHAPDLILYLGSGSVEASVALERARACAAACPEGVALAGLAFDGGVNVLSAGLASAREFAVRKVAVYCTGDAEGFAEGVCAMLPGPARLSFARLTGAKKAQALIARSLLKSFTAVCGVIGVQPIPLADMPVLVALQTLMVGLIIHTTGRKAGIRLVAEFLGALGINIGAGYLFREGARALLRVVPFWGNAVSGVVAGAGTYAIGRAAIAYFIEDRPIQETRKLFRLLFPRKGSFAGEPPAPPPASQVLPPPLPPEPTSAP